VRPFHRQCCRSLKGIEWVFSTAAFILLNTICVSRRLAEKVLTCMRNVTDTGAPDCWTHATETSTVIVTIWMYETVCCVELSNAKTLQAYCCLCSYRALGYWLASGRRYDHRGNKSITSPCTIVTPLERVMFVPGDTRKCVRGKFSTSTRTARNRRTHPQPVVQLATTTPARRRLAGP